MRLARLGFLRQSILDGKNRSQDFSIRAVETGEWLETRECMDEDYIVDEDEFAVNEEEAVVNVLRRLHSVRHLNVYSDAYALP